MHYVEGTSAFSVVHFHSPRGIFQRECEDRKLGKWLASVDGVVGVVQHNHSLTNTQRHFKHSSTTSFRRAH